MLLAMKSEARPFAAVFGVSRSGTSWLGAMLDAHPEVAYRFEPIDNIPDQEQARPIIRRLQSGDQDPMLVEELARLLRPAHPRLDRPPFVPKHGHTQRGRTFLNRAGRLLPRIIAPVYRNLYRPPAAAHLIFKEVSKEHITATLARSGRVPIVYIVRHPGAYVASMMVGVEKGVMPETRAQVAMDLAADHAPELHNAYSNRSDQLTMEERLTIAWVADTNLVLETTLACESVHHVVYEQLCLETMPCMERVYTHVGLEMVDQAREFISASSGNADRNELGVDSYFSVYRDSKKSMHKWRQILRQEQVDKIRAVCAYSRACEAFGSHWRWDVEDTADE